MSLSLLGRGRWGAFLGVFLFVDAWAGAFKVLPLGLTLEGDRTSAALRLINTGEAPVTVQVEAVAWTQDERGTDRYAPTGELIYFPRLLTLGAGAEGVVRVAYQGPTVAGRERAFRLYAEEIPEPDGKRWRMALRLGVPVFVRPARLGPARWRLRRVEVHPGRVTVRVENPGARHARIRRVLLRDAGGAWSQAVAGWYLLPGASRVFEMHLPRPHCRRGRPLEVVVEGTEGRRARRRIEATGCVDSVSPSARASG